MWLIAEVLSLPVERTRADAARARDSEPRAAWETGSEAGGVRGATPAGYCCSRGSTDRVDLGDPDGHTGARRV